MPYIKNDERMDIVVGPNIINSSSISSPGQLNYAITLLLIDYIQKNKESYQTYNDIIGVLESAKLEFYRRQVSSYEENKLKENGDVY